ncbi:MAG: TnpV protein [Lachnospiraceae bacterium]|nr:TnpV protein [Lachnospiraceae bacterium]
MTNLQKQIMVNGIEYNLCGDYYVPNIVLEQHDDRTLGKYGMMRRAYLKANKPILYNQLVLTDKLFDHLYEIDESAHSRIDEIMDFELMWDKEIPDKKTDPMGWVQYMNMIKAQAEEIVFNELVFN